MFGHLLRQTQRSSELTLRGLDCAAQESLRNITVVEALILAATYSTSGNSLEPARDCMAGSQAARVVQAYGAVSYMSALWCILGIITNIQGKSPIGGGDDQSC
jgi:hypothetical protein